MSLIIDLIIAVVAVVCIYHGISRGFIRSVMRFVSIIIAVAAVIFLTEPVAVWLNDVFVTDKVTEITEDSLEGIVGDSEAIFDLDRLLGDSGEVLDDISERFSVNLDGILDGLSDKISSFTEKEALDTLSQTVAEPTANAISTVAAAIIVFVATLLIMALITLLLDLVCKLPVLKRLNKVLGFLFGVASALLTTLALSNIAVGLVRSMSAINSTVFNEAVIDSSLILGFFTANNLIFFG